MLHSANAYIPETRPPLKSGHFDSPDIIEGVHVLYLFLFLLDPALSPSPPELWS